MFETEQMDGVRSAAGKMRFWKGPEGGFCVTKKEM